MYFGPSSRSIIVIVSSDWNFDLAFLPGQDLLILSLKQKTCLWQESWQASPIIDQKGQLNFIEVLKENNVYKPDNFIWKHNFSVQKNLGSNKIFFPEKFWVQRKFWSKQLFIVYFVLCVVCRMYVVCCMSCMYRASLFKNKLQLHRSEWDKWSSYNKLLQEESLLFNSRNDYLQYTSFVCVCLCSILLGI